jgi:hypothetical protein
LKPLQSIVAIFALTTVTLSSLLLPAAADSYNQGMPTTNIGSVQWERGIPFTSPSRKSNGNQTFLNCPKGFRLWKAGIPVRKVNGNTTSTTISINPRKFITVAWLGGGNKKVRQGTSLCQQNRKPMKPESPQELSQWTFVSEKNLAVPIGIVRPPIETCVPAVRPTSWMGTVVNGPANGTGIWTIRWRLEGGQGFIRYQTALQTSENVYRKVLRQVLLNPEGTDIEVSQMLSYAAFTNYALMLGSWIPGGIDPDCGQGFLPPWIENWDSGSSVATYLSNTSGTLDFDVTFVVRSPMTNPVVEFESEAWGRPQGIE